MSYGIKRYLQAFVASSFIFFLLSFYIYLRRGYYDLYIANKVFAGTSFILIGLILLLGPFGRIYSWFDRFLIHRREFGIFAFILGLVHSFTSLFFLTDHFSLADLMGNKLTFTAALVSIAILFYLFLLSLNRIAVLVDKKKWWLVQNWGIRLLALFLLFHVIPMKYPGWIRWYTFGGGKELVGPYLPPAGLLVLSFGVYVSSVRFSEFIGKEKAGLLVNFFSLVFAVFLVFSFWWGSTKTPRALPLDWETCIRLPGSVIQESYPSVCVGPGGRHAKKPL